MNGFLKSLRLEKGWSQEQLAEIADISVRTVQRLENGETCSLDTAKALAIVFDSKHEIFLERFDRTTGPDAENDLLCQVRLERKVRRRYKFYQHLVIYLAVNMMLITINLLTNPDHYWFFYPLVGWGLGLGHNAMRAFSPDWEDRLIKKMIQKEKNQAV